jgi:hypothetical protein
MAYTCFWLSARLSPRQVRDRFFRPISGAEKAPFEHRSNESINLTKKGQTHNYILKTNGYKIPFAFFSPVLLLIFY